MFNLKYYDGFGKDVTDYVTGLEKKIVDLEKELSTYKVVEVVEPEVAVTVEEEKPKPKRKRRKKVNANSP